jgi:hypothetical protein
MTWVIDAAEDREWRDLAYPGKPSWLAISLKFAPTADGVAVAGVQVTRRDGRAVTARDLRMVKMPPSWVLFGEAAARWYQPSGDRITPTRKGPRGQDDKHWRSVWVRWQEAQEIAPRAPVRWMLTHWPEVSDATMRRWIKRARAKAEENDWEHGYPAGSQGARS